MGLADTPPQRCQHAILLRNQSDHLITGGINCCLVLRLGRGGDVENVEIAQSDGGMAAGRIEIGQGDLRRCPRIAAR